MAGLIVVGIFVARARRWPAPTRYLPLVASLLIPLDLAVSWAPDTVRDAVMALYLALTYGLLGLFLIRDAASLASRVSTSTPAVEPARR